MIAELLSDHLFASECIPSQRSYTSVVDLHGLLFAITRTGTVDLIHYQKGNFIVNASVIMEFLKSTTDRFDYHLHLFAALGKR